MAADIDFESLVEGYYQSLYKFALSLTGSEADACDLTQQTFYVWATKGHQLRDRSKVKNWLFTTLHREFLESRRRLVRFPHHELSYVNDELPPTLPTAVERADAATAIACLAQIDEANRAPLALFYLENCSYKEIAEILEVPLGTVQSRIARGKARLAKLLCNEDRRPQKEDQRT